MPASRAVRVVVINSLSYSGTTWLNAVLGSHRDAFALGPADRLWETRDKGWKEACRIHGKTCPFWPNFHREYDRGSNFFIQLAEASGKEVIVTNNPSSNGLKAQMHHRDIDIRHVQLVRDGRSLAASYCRHHPEKSMIEALGEFIQPSFHRFAFDPDNPDLLSLRYEDILANKAASLHRLGAYVGLKYEAASLRFWEHEHHLASGNQGVVALIRFGQGLPVQNFKAKSFYERQFETMQRTQDSSFQDERWRAELSTRELFLFDVFAGDDNARFGYERDRFTLDEVLSYSEEVAALMTAGGIPRTLSDLRSLEIHGGQGGAAQVHYFGHPAGNMHEATGLRHQFSPARLRIHGLYLSPAHLKAIRRLALKIGSAIVLGLAIVLAVAVAVAF